jgi:hypothetical protein
MGSYQRHDLHHNIYLLQRGLCSTLIQVQTKFKEGSQEGLRAS